MIFRGRTAWLTVLLLLIAAVPLAAQTTHPAPPAVQGVLEKKAIQRPASIVNTKSTSGTQPPSVLTTGMDTTRVVLSLLLVIAAIFLLRWIAQQFFGAPSTKRSSRAVQVLSRSMIAPRQHVLVLQVGRRLVVVGDSGSQMNPLCEITDADEIASLIGQLRQDKAAPVTRAFGSVFRRAEKDYSSESSDGESSKREVAEDAELDPALATTQAELSGLIDKVRSVSKQIGQ